MRAVSPACGWCVRLLPPHAADVGPPCMRVRVRFRFRVRVRVRVRVKFMLTLNLSEAQFRRLS